MYVVTPFANILSAITVGKCSGTLKWDSTFSPTLCVRRGVLRSGPLPIHLMNLVCLLLAIDGTPKSYRNWTAIGREWPGQS
jgi:hypothetical protein